MTSSWRWGSDDEFQRHVFPHALNEVPHVRQSYTIYSFAECVRQMHEDLVELRQALESFETMLEQKAQSRLPDRAAETAVEICYLGESVLRYQKRLVLGEHAYGFLHGKETIPHAAHKTHRPPRRYDLKRLAEDTRKLLKGFDEMELADSSFLLSEIDLPDDLMRDFRLARDLFSVGFDEVGLLISGRGLERVLRTILADRSISRGGHSTRPAAEGTLNDMIESLEKLRWKVDKKRFLPRGAVEILHLLRTVRNIGAHAPTEEVPSFSPPRELALLIGRAANQLWRLHTSKRRKRLIIAV
jgi:hypothetical protein